MRSLDLLPIGELPAGMLQHLASALAHVFHVPCEALPYSLNPQFALHAERQQYHSSQVLSRMHGHLRPSTWRVLGVTAVDLYIPILTFVFGEAQMGGPCALVHEIGHTLDLSHCSDYQCAMAPSHAVEWIDLKEGALCPSCSSRVFDAAL